MLTSIPHAFVLLLLHHHSHSHRRSSSHRAAFFVTILSRLFFFFFFFFFFFVVVATEKTGADRSVDRGRARIRDGRFHGSSLVFFFSFLYSLPGSPIGFFFSLSEREK
jgi:heme/copper-type cytochrome/quinol oxidase subunit 3